MGVKDLLKREKKKETRARIVFKDLLPCYCWSRKGGADPADRDQCSRVRAAVGVTGLWGGPAGRMKAGTGYVHHCLFRGDRSGLPGRHWRRGTRASYTRGDGKRREKLTGEGAMEIFYFLIDTEIKSVFGLLKCTSHHMFKFRTCFCLAIQDRHSMCSPNFSIARQDRTYRDKKAARNFEWPIFEEALSWRHASFRSLNLFFFVVASFLSSW